MSNHFAAHFLSVAEAGAPVWERATVDTYRAATPLPGWTIRELISHTVTTIDEAAAAFERVPVAGELAPSGAVPGAVPEAEDDREYQPLMEVHDILDAPAASFARALVRIAESVEPLDPASEAVMAWGNYEVGSLASMMLVDALVHTWDLAQALGVQFQMPQAAAETAFSFSQQMLAPELRSADGDAPFGLEVPVPADAPLQDRLLGWLGRTPH